MKKFAQLILIAFAVVILAGCKVVSSQVFKVQAPDGTEIYSPDMKHLATVSSGQAEIKLSEKTFYAYLLSRSQGSQDYIPFALDFKNTSENAAKYTMNLLGCTTLLSSGLIFVATGAGTGEYALLATGIAALGGGTLLFRNIKSKPYIQFQNGYRYLDLQTTNQDLVFSFPDNTISTRMSDAGSTIPSPTIRQTDKERTVSTTQQTSTARSRVISERSNRTLNIGAKKAEGTYLGNGNLRLDNKIIEDLNDIRIYVKMIDKSTVNVEVIEANGNSFFQKPSRYSVKQESSQKLILTHESIPYAIITINGMNMVYSHPRVNIDGNIYTLQIKGQKE